MAVGSMAVGSKNAGDASAGMPQLALGAWRELDIWPHEPLAFHTKMSCT